MNDDSDFVSVKQKVTRLQNYYMVETMFYCPESEDPGRAVFYVPSKKDDPAVLDAINARWKEMCEEFQDIKSDAEKYIAVKLRGHSDSVILTNLVAFGIESYGENFLHCTMVANGH